MAIIDSNGCPFPWMDGWMDECTQSATIGAIGPLTLHQWELAGYSPVSQSLFCSLQDVISIIVPSRIVGWSEPILLINVK